MSFKKTVHVDIRPRFTTVRRQSKSGTYIEYADKEVNDDIIAGYLRSGGDLQDCQRVPFLSVPHSVDVKGVINTIVDNWDVPTPRIVLFVISTSASLSEWTNRKEIDLFVAGIIKCLNSTEMWLCTPGMDGGISKEIGTALSKEMMLRKMMSKTIQDVIKRYPETALIGVCRQDALQFSEKISAGYGTTQAEKKLKVNKDGKRSVDFNHEYFILVRDKSEGKSGVSDFLLDFENYLVEKNKRFNYLTSASPQSRQINMHLETPVIAILVGGNINKVDFILAHLQLNLPLIILRGSGGLADLLAYAHDQVNWSEYRDPAEYTEYVEKFLKPLLSQQICNSFPDLEESNLLRSLLCDKIFDCVRCVYQQDLQLQFITVLNVKDPRCKLDHLPEHLLRALFKSRLSDYDKNRKQMTKDLHIAMDWNLLHLAVDEVFAKASGRSFRIDNQTFYRALTKYNRQEFVKLFLSKGFEVHKFLNSKTLLKLFEFSKDRDFFRKIVLQGATGFPTLIEFKSDFFNRKLNMLLKDLTGIPRLISTFELDYYSKKNYGDNSEVEAEQKAIQVLIIWAILTYRIPLAKAIWTESQQPVHLALMCSAILHKLLPYVIDTDLRNEMSSHSKEFSKMAYGVLSKCHEELPCRADDVLYEENVVWSYKSVIEIAAFAKNKSFLAHPCCQRWLDSVFMGHIRIRDAPYGAMRIPVWLKIILSAFLIFPIYLWVRFNVPAKKVTEKRERIHCSVTNELDGNYRPMEKDPQSKEYKGRNKQELKIWDKIYYMWMAPITKFWVLQVFYVIYLTLLSLAAIWPSCGNHFLDFILCMWTSIIIMDSIYNAYTLHKKYPSIPLFYKFLEISFMTLFTVLYSMGRLFPHDMFIGAYYSKVLICFGLLFFYYRIIFLSMPISKQMGPLLYRVKRMTLVDFANFSRMALLVMISNGIILQAIIYPDHPMGFDLFFKAMERAWTSLFLAKMDDWGTPLPECVMLKKYIGENYYVGFKNFTCRAGRYYGDECPSPGIWPYVFGVQYVMLLRLILLTLLTALFTNTQTKLQEEGDHIWRYQRYEIIVDFEDRMCLPAPLSIISFIVMVIRAVINKCRGTSNVKRIKEEKTNKLRFRHWQNIARHYSNVQKENTLSTTERMKQMSLQMEMINTQRLMIHEEQSQLAELHCEIQNIYLQTDKYILSVRELLRRQNIPQIYSRRSPYIDTGVHRTPVTDRNVPWRNLWVTYHPIAFTQFSHLFPVAMRDYLDLNVHAMQQTEGDDFKMPMFQWNAAVTSPAGVYFDRQSWIVDRNGKLIVYRLDKEGLPENPMGRTGLRGRGCLPRWGPNHFVFVIITQCHDPLTRIARQFFDVAIQSTKKRLTLPGGFVGIENRYQVVHDVFKCDESWSGAADMVSFFKSAAVNPEDESQFKFRRVHLGYMDSAMNTDQAWCEAEIWHFHYATINSIRKKFHENLSWHLLTHEVLEKLTIGQAALLYNVTKEMNANLESVWKLLYEEEINK